METKSHWRTIIAFLVIPMIFVQHEYGLPFLIGLLTTIILILLLTIK